MNGYSIKLFFVGFFLLAGGALAEAQMPVQELPREPLRIVTAGGEAFEFSVEVASTPNQRSIGLMNRERLGWDTGMLFDYGRPRRVSMWMKNTLIPLDMLFIKADGTIANIRERTVPHSLEPIPSKGKVLAVLELAGGSVGRMGLAPGDTVEHAIFSAD